MSPPSVPDATDRVTAPTAPVTVPVAEATAPGAKDAYGAYSAAIVRVTRVIGPDIRFSCGFINYARAFEVELETHESGPELPLRFVFIVQCSGGGVRVGNRLHIHYVVTKRTPGQPRPAGEIPKDLPRRYGGIKRV